MHAGDTCTGYGVDHHLGMSDDRVDSRSNVTGCFAWLRPPVCLDAAWPRFFAFFLRADPLGLSHDPPGLWPRLGFFLTLLLVGHFPNVNWWGGGRFGPPMTSQLLEIVEKRNLQGI